MPGLVLSPRDQRHWDDRHQARRRNRILGSGWRGLSAEPHLAVRLDAFVRQDEALDVVRTIAEIFRDQVGLRESRDRARFKHLFLKEGWTGDRVLSELNRRLGYQLDPAVPEIPPNDILRDHVGIHRQKQAGLSFVGASILRGRITGEQLEAAADLAHRYGSGGLRATVMQNLLFIDVPNEKVVGLAQELNKIDLHVDGSSFWRGAISCTGSEFCKLAVTETKTFTRWLVEEMELRIPEFDQRRKKCYPRQAARRAPRWPAPTEPDRGPRHRQSAHTAHRVGVVVDRHAVGTDVLLDRVLAVPWQGLAARRGLRSLTALARIWNASILTIGTAILAYST
jgi:hypothetical protein